MSNLSKKQFPWVKHYDKNSGITWHIHTASGQRVYNTLHGRYRWQIEGGSHHGELHTSLGEAKNIVETAHQEQNA
jgi:hypothetical protein